MSAPDKAQVLTALRLALDTELEALGRATEMARDEATSAESRPENKYDTRALEASYLAAGQGERLAELRWLVGWASVVTAAPVERIGTGALVEIEHAGRCRWILVAPRGGLTLAVDGVEVRLVSASSPLGEVLAGLEAGDVEEVESPSGPQPWTVRTVC